MGPKKTISLFDEQGLRRVREVISHRPLGLAVDIDGTISEIASTPSEAVVTKECKAWLVNLARYLHLVAAISGRPVAEARAMVGLEGIVYMGNHGLERWTRDGTSIHPGATQYVRIVRRTVMAIARSVRLDGLLFEDKGISAAIHFRNAERPSLAKDAILSAIKDLRIADKLRIAEGRMVIELRPPIEMDKGKAITNLAEEHSLGGFIYIGDDLTDVDAFAALRNMRATKRMNTLAIAVLSAETQPDVVAAADLVLNGVPEVERFLGWLGREVANA